MQRLFTFALSIIVLLVLLVAPITAQDEGIVLTPLETNPILTPDATTDWESGVIGSVVLPVDGRWLMFYRGLNADQSTWAAGIATSDDGVTWTRHEGNPVFVADPAVAPYGIDSMTVFYDGTQWIMLFAPLADTARVDVLAATAPSPEGPWTLATDPALPKSSALDWDNGSRWLSSVFATDEGYVLYFSAPGGIGLMTSSDGLHWNRYDDPATTTGRFATSDPVFQKDTDSLAWDGINVLVPLVRHTSDGWEMFYSGVDNSSHFRIGYATSPDGITWTRPSAEPVLTEEGSMWLLPTGLAETEERDILYYTDMHGSLPGSWMVDAAEIGSP